MTTGLGPNFALRALPTGPAEEEGDLRRPLPAPSYPYPSPFLSPHPLLLLIIAGHRTRAQHSLPSCCTAIPMEAIQDTRAACSSNASTNSTKKTPKERSTPNTSADWKNAESTTIHPQPPSGGSALSAIWEVTEQSPPRTPAVAGLRNHYLCPAWQPASRTAWGCSCEERVVKRKVLTSASKLQRGCVRRLRLSPSGAISVERTPGCSPRRSAPGGVAPLAAG